MHFLSHFSQCPTVGDDSCYFSIGFGLTTNTTTAAAADAYVSSALLLLLLVLLFGVHLAYSCGVGQAQASYY
jgi:hypothetical protein